MAPAATVVIPTFRRPDSLARALRALARQTDPGLRWDAVVVDNDDPPGAADVFNRVAPDLPVAARLVREKGRGASHARNRGISEVNAPITVFLDDDVVPGPHWLKQLLGPIVSGRCEGVAGRVVLDPGAARPRWFTSSWHDVPFGVFDRGEEECLLGATDYLNTANCAVRTDLLRATGGFDPVLGPRDGVPLLNDDVRLYKELLGLGGRVLYVPEAVVVHELPQSRLKRRYIVRREYFRGRSAWLAERERHAQMRFFGTGAVARKVSDDLRQAWHDRPWGTSTLYRVAADVSYASGYGREALRCLLRSRRVEPSERPLDAQDGKPARP